MVLLLLRELGVPELVLLLLGAGAPELLELTHGDRVVLGGEVLLEVDDGVLALGHFWPLSVGGVLPACRFSQLVPLGTTTHRPGDAHPRFPSVLTLEF